MLVFVIPLKSARASRSWDRVTRLVRRTVRSACGQTCPEFRVVLCCHEVPELGFEDKRIVVLPPPADPPAANVDLQRRDKGLKVLAGLQWARDNGPCHAMVLDADDCVSRRLAQHVAANPERHGWFISRGYIHQEGRPNLHVSRRFHQWCGSSHLVRPEHLDLPTRPIEDWYLPHKEIVSRMRKRGTPLERLPFPGGVYNVSHGDNFREYAHILWPRNPVRALARRVLFQRPLTPAIREEFGLYPLDQDP